MCRDGEIVEKVRCQLELIQILNISPTPEFDFEYFVKWMNAEIARVYSGRATSASD